MSVGDIKISASISGFVIALGLNGRGPVSAIQHTREALEALWWQRLLDAFQNLDFTFMRVEEVQQDTQSGAIHPIDGDRAYRTALQAEQSAIEKYARVLKAVTDLVVDGIIPADGSYPDTAGASRWPARR